MNTLVPIDCNELQAYGNEDLIKHALPEIISKIRGKHPDFKKQVIDTLTRGQKSLFMFLTVYYHNVLGLKSFVNGYSYEIDRGFLEEIRSGLEYLGCTKLLDIIIRCEKNYLSNVGTDLKSNQYEELDSEYEKIKNVSLENAANYIRNHHEEFYAITEEV